MKRSEMVDDILNVLIEFNNDHKSLEHTADFLVDFIQSRGMLPPLQDGQDGFGFTMDSYCPVNYLEWEEEEGENE